MEMKSVVHVETEKDGKKFTFVMDATASYGAAYDAAFEVLEKLVEMASEAKERAKRKDPVEK
jgi:hypothetical protein